MIKKIRYNSPVILTFSFLSLFALLLGKLTNGWTTIHLFSVYRASLLDPLIYPRFFLHVLGHANYSHFIGNILLLLVIGPAMEEKYGSGKLLTAILITAGIAGIIQFALFPSIALLGASGIVYMLVILSSLGGLEQGTIPLTLIFVAVFYIGGQIVDGLFVKDNISQLTHMIGGICGGVFGYAYKK